MPQAPTQTLTQLHFGWKLLLPCVLQFTVKHAGCDFHCAFCVECGVFVCARGRVQRFSVQTVSTIHQPLASGEAVVLKSPLCVSRYSQTGVVIKGSIFNGGASVCRKRKSLFPQPHALTMTAIISLIRKEWVAFWGMKYQTHFCRRRLGVFFCA